MGTAVKMFVASAWIALLSCGCIDDDLSENEDLIPGSINCLVEDVKVRFSKYREFSDNSAKWEYFLRVRLSIENNTQETLSLRKFHLESFFSETDIYARDKAGRDLKFKTMDLGRIGNMPVVYIVRDLRPGECSHCDLDCEVLAFGRDELPEGEMEWFFPGRQTLFCGDRSISENESAFCEFKIHVKDRMKLSAELPARKD